MPYNPKACTLMFCSRHAYSRGLPLHVSTHVDVGVQCCAAVPCTEWSARESFAAEAGAMNDIDLRQRAEDMPLGVSLRIMSAPASFALPMVQRKPFKPAFQVRLSQIP